MAKMSIEEQLAEIEKKERAIQKRKRALKAKLSSQARKEDTRRKVLVGALVIGALPDLRPNSKRREWILQLLEGLTHERDRKLFADLLPDAPNQRRL